MSDRPNDPATADDALAAFDLSAWEAPPVRTGLADAVVTAVRAHDDVHAPAVAATTGLEPDERTPRRRWWIAAAVLVPVAAFIASMLWNVQRVTSEDPAIPHRTVLAAPDTRRAPAPPVDVEPAQAPPVDAAACDAVALADKAKDEMSKGMDALALATVQRSLACKADPDVTRLAFVIACRAEDRAKARAFWRQLPPSRATSSLAQVCLRNGIAVSTAKPPTPVAPVSPPPVCDAAALKAQGDDRLNRGDDAGALRSYEASMGCRPDANVVRLAMLASCRAKNWRKATLYYRQVPASQAQGIKQVCIRAGFDPSAPDADAVAAAAPSTEPTTGTLSVAGRAETRILIDGKDTGKRVPATFELVAGKHRVTYDNDGDRYTFAVTVVAGEKVLLAKELK